MTSIENLLNLLDAPMEAAAAIDPSNPQEAVTTLQETYPFDGPGTVALGQALVAAVEDGVICDRGEPALQWSRLAKPEDTPHHLSVDAVWMAGAGPLHRHPKGEINLCFAVEGSPLFDDHPEGWVVFPPDSVHVPTVTGGRMLIVYFLPNGEMEFVRET